MHGEICYSEVNMHEGHSKVEESGRVLERSFFFPESHVRRVKKKN